MLNKIFLMGRLTRDPEKRHTQNGTAVASFALAVERDYKEQGSDKRPTDFIEIVAWRQQADFVCKYFAKGRMAVVEGRLQVRDWTDKDGNKRRFGDSKKETGTSTSGNAPESSMPPPTQAQFQEMNDDDGQLPF